MTLFLYILRQLVQATLFAVVGLGFVVFPGVAVSAVHKLGGVSIGAVMRYIPMVGAELAPYLLSLGFLLATVSTFGRLAADKEWIAISMSGKHPLRTMLPGLLLAVVLGSATYVLAAELSPRWKYESSNFRANALLEEFRALAPGRTEIDFGKFYLNAQNRESDSGAFRDVQIRIPRPDGTEMPIIARRAALGFTSSELVIQLEDMHSVTEQGRLSNERMQFNVPLQLLVERRDRDPSRAKYRTSGDMLAALGAGEAPPELESSYVFELHRRYALGAMFLVFLVVGVATGLWLRSGQQLAGLGTSAVYAFVYYVLSMRLGRELALSGALSPVLAAWTTNLLGAALALFLMWRVVLR